MDNITAEELAHSSLFDQIENYGSLKGRIQFAYVEDQASYVQNQPTFFRLEAIEQLLTNDKIDFYVSRFQSVVIQPIVNLSLASAYLSWWDPTLPFKTPLDQFIQRLLSKVGSMVSDISYRIENKLKLNKSFDQVIDNFTPLRIIG